MEKNTNFVLSSSNRIHEVLRFSKCGNLVHSPSDLDPNERVELIGYQAKPLLIDGKFLHSDFELLSNRVDLNLFEVAQLNGEGFVVFKLDDTPTYGVVADYFSFSTLFYSVVYVDGCNELLISNSFRGVQEKLRNLSSEKANEVAWEMAIPHLASSHNLFRTRASYKTFSKNIRVLNQDEILIFNKDKIEVKKRPILLSGGDSYEYHIEKGIEKAVSDIKEYCAQGLPVQLSLSGGKDSRMLLALFIAAECEHYLRVTTANPRNLPSGPSKDILLKDFEIAAKLVSYYDLKWSGDEVLSNEEMDFNESLSRWQNFRSNNSFEVVPSYNVSGPLKGFNIYMAGIGGELVRSYIGAENRDKYPQWWAKAGKSFDSKAQDLKAFFKIVCPMGSITKHLYASAQREFSDSFSFSQAADVIDCLDFSYMNYRSRAHAGVGAFNYESHKITAYPICQADFLKASRLLSREDQEDGRVIFDVMKKIDPKLLSLEFASPPWPSRFMVSTTPFSWHEVKSEFAVSEFYENEKHKIVSNCRKRKGKEISYQEMAVKRVKSNIEKIVKKMKLDGVSDSGLDKRMVRNLYMGDKPLLSMLGVTESVVDVFDPVDDVVIDVFSLCLKRDSWKHYKLNHSPSSSSEKINEIVVDEELCSLFNHYDLTNVSASLCVRSDAYSVLSLQSLPSHVDVAVYWYLNGEKVSVDWYEHKQKFHTDCFLGLTRIEDARATVFLRMRDESEAARVFHVTAEYFKSHDS
ncbi:hypothetical protein ACUN7Z_09040 [Vreelandella venusta]|uniref:hypothetical protein n=1 Tax=Vreelandella venusta TaxID=44935 RepID=UPI004044FA0F